MEAKKIIEIMGGSKEVQRLTKTSPANVYHWINGTRKIPYHWLAFFHATKPNEIPPPSEILEKENA